MSTDAGVTLPKVNRHACPPVKTLQEGLLQNKEIKVYDFNFLGGLYETVFNVDQCEYFARRTCNQCYGKGYIVCDFPNRAVWVQICKCSKKRITN